jgi:hypothetical protein
MSGSRHAVAATLCVLAVSACGRIRFDELGDGDQLEDGGALDDAASLLIISFQDGVAPDAAYAGTSDTFIRQSDPDSNFGANGRASLDGDNPQGSGNDDSALLRWDVSMIPSNAMVVAAAITVTSDSDANDPFDVYELLKPWSEQDATWNAATAATPWQTAGALDPMDRAPAPLGQIPLDLAQDQPTPLALDSSGVAMVQRWIGGQNHGVIITNTISNDGLNIATCEAITLAFRPMLTVTYTMP